MSGGKDDKLATPQHHTEVRDSLLHSGFASVRLETFKGGHALSELELRKALNWLMEQYGRTESRPAGSPLRSQSGNSINSSCVGQVSLPQSGRERFIFGPVVGIGGALGTQHTRQAIPVSGSARSSGSAPQASSDGLRFKANN